MGGCACFEGAAKSTGGGSDGGGGSKPKNKKEALADAKKLSAGESEMFMGGLDFIGKVPLFKTLPLQDHPLLAKAFELKKYGDGELIIKQGDMGDRFFCIKGGKAKVIIDNIEVNNFKAGDYFGEVALLLDKPRNATIKADGPLECLEIARKDFDALELRKKLHFKKRKAMHDTAESGDGEMAKPTSKTAAEADLIREALLVNKNIGQFIKDVDKQDIQAIVDYSFPQTVDAKNTEVITQGDVNANLFYIIQEGTGEAIKDGVKVASYKSKDSFGGLALLYQAPRAATVRVTPGTKLWCVPRDAFRKVLRAHTQATVEQYKKILSNVKCLDHVSDTDKMTLADALIETTYESGQFVIKEGDDNHSFFILKDGELGVSEGGQPTGTYRVEQGKQLPFFGDRALIHDELSKQSVKVTSQKAAHLLVLGRSVYLQVVKPSKEEDLGDLVKYDRANLKNICLLGCGGFGKVTLEKDTSTGQFFALKALSKGHIMKENQQLCVMNEKRILCMTNSPFLVQCAATFNSKEHLLFLLAPAMGGELYTIYIHQRFHGEVKNAMFYSACVIRGLEHLHERSIIYRDMKPENLLLDQKGYCKITDFGLAKFVIGKTFTICGTLDYFAPELLKGTGHNTSLDWWTLGILIYEFMMGQPPFEADDPGKLFEKMMSGIDKARWPKNKAKANWPDLVTQLCKIDPSERIAVKAGGSKNVVKHQWYADAGFDWASLTSRTMTPPWDPKVKAMDGSNFDANEEDAPPEYPYKDPRNGWDTDFENVMGPKIS